MKEVVIVSAVRTPIGSFNGGLASFSAAELGAMTIAGLVGAVLFAAIGIAELAFVNRSIYPAMRWRYEKAKTTQSQGLRPSVFMALVKIQSLILLPLVGFVLGNGMAKSG